MDLKQYIHLDNPYNCEKLRETLRPFQSMPNLKQRNPYSGGPMRNLHGDFNTQTVNSSSQGQKLVVSSVAGEAHTKKWQDDAQWKMLHFQHYKDLF